MDEETRPRDPSSLALSADATAIVKIEAANREKESFFSKEGIDLNIKKDGVVSVIFGNGSDYFNASEYKNEKFVHTRNVQVPNECLYAIKKFDEGIKIGKNNGQDIFLKEITTEVFPNFPSSYDNNASLDDYGVCKIGNVNFVKLTYAYNSMGEVKKRDMLFPFKNNTLYIRSFYCRVYNTNGIALSYTAQNVNFQDKIFFENGTVASYKRRRNIIVSSVNDISDDCELIGNKAFYVDLGQQFSRTGNFSQKGYIKYYALCFKDKESNETYEIGFKVEDNKYFYPTVIETLDSSYGENKSVIFRIYGEDNNGYNTKYHCQFTKATQSTPASKRKLKDTIISFYMNDRPTKLTLNGIWAPRVETSLGHRDSDGGGNVGNSYAVRYLRTSQDCYFELKIKANTEEDPKDVKRGRGDWKEDIVIYATEIKDSFKNAMVREFAAWKRWTGNDMFEHGGEAAGWNGDIQRNANVSPVELLSAGSSVERGGKLYEVTYKKVSNQNIWGVNGAWGSPKIYVQNGILYEGNSRQCVSGNPFENTGGNLTKKFAAFSVLRAHEGTVENFYTCDAGAVTYGVGSTWVAANKDSQEELQYWKEFILAAKQKGIKISLLHENLKDFNTKSNEGDNFVYELYQAERGESSPGGNGQIYFRRIGGEKLKANPTGKVNKNLLPLVKVPLSHIDKKLETAVESFANDVFNIIKQIETIRNPDGSCGSKASDIGFASWIADTSGKYTIRSRITQEQWDYLVDAKYQGNGDLFKHIKRGRAEDGNGIACSYSEFCERVLKAIEHENAYQERHPNKNYYIRNKEWRNGAFKRAFSNVPPESPVNNADNTQDNVCYYAHEITITCYSMGRGKIDTVMADKYSSSNTKNPRSYISYHSMDTVGGAIFDNEDDIVYYLTSYYEEDARSDAERAIQVRSDEVDWENFKKIVNRWSCEINVGERTNDKGDEVSQTLIGVDRYYDFYSGMTPFVQAYFRELKYDDEKEKYTYTWNILNSLHHPYFKSLVVEDKGVKTATLTLFDKDFGSYQYGIILDGDRDSTRELDERMRNNKNEKVGAANFNRKVYSLETIIKKALKQYTANDVNDNKRTKVGSENHYEEFTEEELKDTYLQYDTYKSADPTNLRIRFGYADDNPPVSEKKQLGDTGDKKATEYNNKKYNGNEGNKRDYRWYDVKNFGSAKSMEVIPEKYVNNGEIADSNGKIKIASTDTQQIDNSKGVEVGEERKLHTHMDLTTLKSYVRNYMIIGYETSLKPNGIQYTIKAVETGYASLMRKRFLQRYHELTSNPIEVLAALMTIFNEPQEGVPNKKSGFKIYYAKYKDEKGDAADTINMLFDFGSLSEKDREKNKWAKDSYTVATLKNGNLNLSDFGRELYKKITVKLGGESALGNMGTYNYGKPALYKSVGALMDEFCTACPSKKFGVKDTDAKVYDKDGNEITNESYETMSRLGWFLGKYEDANGNGLPNNEELCIVLYYKRPQKLGRIRVYRWGPELPFKTVVKSLSIKNNNEFAVLSAIDTFQPGANGAELKCRINVNNIDIGNANDGETEGGETKLIAKNLSVSRSYSDLSKELNRGGAEIAGYVVPNDRNANLYDTAFASCMYTGTMEILGDPSLEFNMLFQPYTYPIRLEVFVPRNELSFKSMNWKVDGSSDRTIYNEIIDAEKYYGARQNLGLHQVHEMSGYYVITSITHNISPSGYTTTLGIASYPNIERDVLDLDSNKKPIQPSYLY